MEIKLSQCKALRGEIRVSADKSISHRTLIFSALARGRSSVQNFLQAQDTLSTCRCLGQLGVDIRTEKQSLIISGKGWEGLKEAEDVLDCGNSGTTMRLLSGLLAGLPFFSVLSGDRSLRQRPMRRIMEPLRMMGATLYARQNGLAPLVVIGGSLAGIEYQLPVASAQLKTALLLAGLQAEGKTVLREVQPSRDHSERMLSAMGADLIVKPGSVTLNPGKTLEPQQFLVPGDISSAAFFLVAASIVPGSELMIRDVGVNPTRAGVIEVLDAMGADIIMENRRTVGGEPVADLLVKSAPLRGTVIDGGMMPKLIDEVPVLAVAMAAADGESRVEDAGELRVKESDRLAAICSELNKMGACVEEMPQGLTITGRPESLRGAEVHGFGDHRIAMSLAVAALVARGETVLKGAEVVDISFPQFWPLLEGLTTKCL
ncbi:MAG TPA: 3-phosphoshikimate 1-carboxyvinyltransferase [Syntrophomonas sp.]|nr:3-phosphoshikimate 1-carboxyvinyltransferase [Syntrophomonas sp.]